MRTTIALPGPLLKAAKRRATERGVTLSAVVEDALRIHLAGAELTPAEPFHLHTVLGSLVDPNLELDRTSALVAMEDEADYGWGQR